MLTPEWDSVVNEVHMVSIKTLLESILKYVFNFIFCIRKKNDVTLEFSSLLMMNNAVTQKTKHNKVPDLLFQ